MIPEYETNTLLDIYPTSESILSDYETNGLPMTISKDSMKTLYLLLIARYGNNPIANRSIEQFKLKLFSTVFQYAPTWEKRLEIQAKIRGLSDDELMKGATNIYNTALNPSSEPSEQSTQELGYINQQNVNKYVRSKPDAYGVIWELLKVDVTENLLNAFRKLFKTVVAPEQPLLYSDDYCKGE